MQTTTLIHTIGNSDWQFDSSISAAIAKQYLDENSRNPGFLLPRSDKFRDYTFELLNLIQRGGAEGEAIRKYSCFPMLEAACNFVMEREGALGKVVLIGTDQAPPFRTDTVHVLNAVKCLKTDTHSIETEIFTRALKGEEAQPYILEKVLEILATYPSDKVYLSINQGIPEITYAFKIAGFRRNYHYLEQAVQPDGTTKCETTDYGYLYQFIETIISQGK